MLLEIVLVCVHHTVKPWKKLFCTVVGVENNWNAICGCDGADVLSSCHGSCDRGGLIFVVDTLAKKISGVDEKVRPCDDYLSCEVGCTALRSLKDDWSAFVAGCL